MSGKPVLLGLLCGAGAIVFMALPQKVKFSSDGFDIFGRVDVKCGSVFSSNTEVDFDDFSEGQSYRNTVISFGEPNIFEGKTATQVCDKKIKDVRTTGLVAGGIGAVLLIVGLSGRNKAKTPNFLPAGPPPSGGTPPPVARATPMPPSSKVDNPARWAADPFGRYELRHWNGKKWTEHVIRDGKQTVDPPRREAPTAPSTPAPASSTSILSPPVLNAVLAAPPVVAPTLAVVSPFDDLHDDDAHDGRTIQRPVRSSIPILTLSLSTGATIQTRGTVAIGRRPPEADGLQVVAIDDPLLSKCHLRVGIDATGPWAQDTHSTNGVEIKLADGGTRRLTAGVRTPLAAPARLTFGDSWCDLVNE